ncbi:MAG: Mbov_0395 family pilin-like conjugal transfer protein, partial [Christensenellales bacterium]
MSLSGLLYTELEGDYAFLNPILKVLNDIIWPILIVVAAVGTIYAIYLGVMMAKAENAEKREEAKKRVINAVIAVVVMVVLILLLQLFIQFAPDILGVDNAGSGEGSGVIGLLKAM